MLTTILERLPVTMVGSALSDERPLGRGQARAAPAPLGAAQGWTNRVRPPGSPSLRHAPAGGGGVFLHRRGNARRRAGGHRATHNANTLCHSRYLLDDEAIARCDASRGWAMVPGYDEYRCLPGVSRDLTAHVRHMASAIGT